MKSYGSRKWYSVIVALTMIWFLLVMTVWVFNLVLRGLNDNRGIGNYIKAYFWAEAWQELALLKVKEKWYGLSDSIEHTINNRSVVLSDNALEPTQFKWEDVFISYDLGTKTDSYTGTLQGLEYDIIPLFYLTGSDIEEKATDISLSVLSWNSDDLVWNIVSQFSGVSGTGSFDRYTPLHEKRLVSWSFDFLDTTVESFLSTSSNNYLILFHSNNSDDLVYNLTSASESSFSKPSTHIISSAQVWKYRQNLDTYLDNTKYLDFLKYSIYSKK